MNILLITPGINKTFNDNYQSYRYIADNNNDVLAISNKESTAKGGSLHKDLEVEVDGSLVIHRVFNTKREQQSFLRRLPYKKKLKNLVSEFRPDVIFCEEISNLRLALEMKREYGVPVILRTEFAFNSNYPYRSMGRLLKIFKNPLTGDRLASAVGGLIWRWAYSKVDSVISCFHEDVTKEPKVNNTPFYYVPWPTFHPKIEGETKRRKDRAVFIGAFESHKNIPELLVTIPELLQKTPLKEFCFVGGGSDLGVIEQLKASYPDSITHIQSLSREECLKLIRDSFFAYSPATRGGWGFVGDSWAMQTPIILTHNHYGFCDDIDSVVATPQDIANRVNSLYKNESEFDRVRMGGYKRYVENHAADAIGARFLEICLLTCTKFSE
ncbi:MAG: glycosyltransferase [SAR86 cluster bacterium]|nr:glycosyltransferase [SAR86 cluster bacterium]